LNSKPLGLTLEAGALLSKTCFGQECYLVGIAGALIGGRWSDRMLQKGYSNSAARKAPIITGFALSTVILAANYTDSLPFIILFMAIAFFGQAVASTVAGALLSDVAPKGLVGLTGGLLYFTANVGGTLAPLVVGYIVQATGDYNLALAYVSAVAAFGIIGYVVVMGKVHRIVLQGSD